MFKKNVAYFIQFWRPFGTKKKPFEGTIVFPFKANVEQTCQCLKEFSMTDPLGVSPLPPFTDESDNENSPG